MFLFFWLGDKAVHLLSIDGYLCHKVHKAVKVFCQPFDKYLEDLWREIHNDTKLNTDIKTALKDLCLLLELHYNKPSEPVKHRWLSVYRTTVTNLPMDGALFVLCYSWLSKDGKLLYNYEEDNIIPEVNDRLKIKKGNIEKDEQEENDEETERKEGSRL